MTQIAFKQLTKQWVALSDLITVEDDKSYYIQNHGKDVLYACEGNVEPKGTSGIIVQPYKMLIYKKGVQTLYLKAFEDTCAINISSEG